MLDVAVMKLCSSINMLVSTVHKPFHGVIFTAMLKTLEVPGLACTQVMVSLGDCGT